MPNLTKSVAMTDGGGGIKRKKAGTTNQTAQSQTGNTASAGTGRTVKRSSEGQERSHISQSPASLIGENPISQLSKQRQWQEMKRAVDHATRADTPAAFASSRVKNSIPSTAVLETEIILNQYRREAMLQRKERESRYKSMSLEDFHNDPATSAQYGDSYENYLNGQKDMSSAGIQAQIDDIDRQIEEAKQGGYGEELDLVTGSPIYANADQIELLKTQRGGLEAQLEFAKTREWEEQQKAQILDAGGEELLAKLREYDRFKKGKSEITGEEARAILNGLWEKGYSEDQIMEMVDFAARLNSEDQYDAAVEKSAQFASEHPVLSSLGSVAGSLTSGFGMIDAADQNLRNLLSGKDTPVNYKTTLMEPSGATNAIRGQVASDIEEKTSGWVGSDTPLGNLYSDFYQLSMSMADSLGVVGLSAMGMPYAGVLLGGSAATNAMTEAKGRGASDAQALTMGLLAGVAETVFEQYSIEKLFSLKTPATKVDALKNVLKQAIPEASEEFNTTLANTLADMFVMGDKNQYLTSKRWYMAHDMTAQEAGKQASVDWINGLMADILGGAISGGLFAVGANTINGLQGRRNGNVSQQIYTFTQASGTSAGNRGSQSDTKMQQAQRENYSAQAETATNRKKIVADTTRFDGSILANLNKAREYFIDYAHKNFPSYVVNADTGKSIGISRNGLDKFLSGRIGREKYASGFHIPELIEQAYKVAEANNYHEVQSESIPTYEYYDSPIEIDEKNYTAHIRVRNTLSGDKYYGHTISRVVDEIKIEPSARASVSGFPSVQSVNAIDDSIHIIPLLGQNVNGNQGQKAESSGVGGKGTGLPAVQELSSETLREWLQAAGHTGNSLSALQNLYAQNGMAPKKASQTVLQNLLNRYAGAFQNGTDGVTAQAIAEAAEKDRLERTVAGENARYNGTAEALVEAALRLPWDTEARNLAEQATVHKQAEILGKLEELEAAKKQAGGIQTSEQLLEFTRTIGRLEQELEALEQGRLSDRLDSETLGRLSEAVQNGQAQQATGQTPAYPTAQDTGKLTEGGKNGNVDAENRNDSGRFKEILSSGHVDKAILAQEPAAFKNVSINQMDEFLQSIGYKTMVAAASRSESGAKKIAIKNANHTMNIKQIQFSPGGGMHGPNPYLKFSTNGPGVLKIVFGDPKTYIFNGEDTGKIIFEEDHYD